VLGSKVRRMISRFSPSGGFAATVKRSSTSIGRFISLYRRLPLPLLARSLAVRGRVYVTKRPALKYMDVALDYACNMRCQHCFAETLTRGGGQKVSVEEYHRIAREAYRLGVLHVNLQGGEPLMLGKLGRCITAFMPDRIWISVTTNGFLVDAPAVKKLGRMGVHQLVFSLDSLNASSHDTFRRTEGAHARVLAAIRLARAHGLAVSVNVTVSRESYQSSEQQHLFRWLAEEHIPYNPILACPIGAWSEHYEVMVTPEQAAALDRQIARDAIGQRDLGASWVCRGCSATAEQVYLTPYGDVMPCPFIQISLGNVRHTPLGDLWRGAMADGLFGRYASACWMAENKSFAQSMNRLAQRQIALPVRLEEPGAREFLKAFWHA
jgi:MoaA/NifB/PqqE/SkfB family radical SAM enzyme